MGPLISLALEAIGRNRYKQLVLYVFIDLKIFVRLKKFVNNCFGVVTDTPGRSGNICSGMSSIMVSNTTR